MAYTKTVWVNDSEPDIDAENLNKIEQGIYDAHQTMASLVSGVKGDAETEFRNGNVNLTKANIGLGNVDNTSDANKPVSTATQTALNGKQDTLTFDDSPTASSTNPVKSGGVYSALAGKISTPSGGTAGQFLKKTANGSEWGDADSATWGKISGTLSSQTDLQNALNGKQATLTFDDTPAAGSNNPVKSSGIKTALDGKKPTQTAVTDPVASGNALSFIDSISQNSNGVIAPTKKSVTVDTAPASGSANPITSGAVYTDQARQDSQIEALAEIVSAKHSDDWSVVQKMVQSGLGAEAYPVGAQFEVSHSAYTNILFDVLHHITPNSDPLLKAWLPEGKQYGMVLGMHHVIYSTQFDREEAFYFAEAGLTAGTYNVTITRQPWYAADVGKTFQFTLTNDVPAGGILCWGDYNASREGKNVTVYADRYSTTASQTAQMTEGNAGTALTNLNVFDRTMFGSNDWEESGLRQWLNADVAADWWEPKTQYDRVIGYNTRPGFLYGFNADFKAAIVTGTHKNRSNNVFDSHGTGQAYTTSEKMFLLCNEEVGLAQEQGIECGKLLDYYRNATNADRIKYDISAQTTARNWWLRVPTPYNAYYERVVFTSGALDSSYAVSGYGAVAACVIG